MSTTTATVVPLTAGLTLIGYGLHRLGLWAERRGWIFYRKASRDQAARLGVMTVLSVFHPSVEHVIEQTITERAHIEQSEEGDDPDEPPIGQLPATGLELARRGRG